NDERGGRGAPLRGPGAGSRDTRGAPERRVDRADAHRVLVARALHAEPAPGADEGTDLRAGLGLRLRALGELARRLQRLPETPDRGGRKAEVDPDGSRRRLRAPRAVSWFNNLSFRTRLASVAAAAVALAIILASAVVFIVVRNELRRDFDNGLRARAQSVASAPLHPEIGPHGGPYRDIGGPGFVGFAGYVQAVYSDGTTLRTPDEKVPLPVNNNALEVARGSRGPFFSNATVSGTDLRVLTFPYGPNVALQVARSEAD